ncbi:MAG: glycosyltransferase family 39 protein [Gammaproteobacteria bacterium]|nr:glycosyltransferase family 39 protein [Gammaproteobacteria bacterium]
MFRERTPVWPWWLMALALLTHVVSAFHIGPLADEAYYWTWTQHLQLSYFDHPPMVAWMMWPFTALLGDTLFAIRLPMVLAWFITAAFIYLAAMRFSRNHMAALSSLLIWSSLPIIMGGFHVATPDTPLVMLTAISFYFYLRSLDTGRDSDWMLTGFAAGCALLAKYTAILIPGALFLALLLTRRGRGLLATSGPWLAVLIMLLVFMPVVIWNAQNDWASFLFQFKHGVKELAPAPGELLLAFIIGQLGIVMPWTFLAMALTALPIYKPGTDPLQRLSLQLGFWIPILVFGIAGLTSPSGANWTLSAFVPGSLLLGHWLANWLVKKAGRWRAAVTMVLFLLPLLLVNIVRFPGWMEKAGFNPAQRTQLTHSYGWEKVGRQLQRELSTYGARAQTCTVLAMNYQLASQIALLLGDSHRVSTDPASRISQYDYWRRDDMDYCLYVEQYDRPDQTRPQTKQIKGLGEWYRSYLLQIDNPDNTVRWFAFFTPAEFSKN